VVAPVLVTVDPARTAKESAVPRSTFIAAARALSGKTIRAARQVVEMFIVFLRRNY
jgi:hypothetical protein